MAKPDVNHQIDCWYSLKASTSMQNYKVGIWDASNGIHTPFIQDALRS